MDYDLDLFRFNQIPLDLYIDGMRQLAFDTLIDVAGVDEENTQKVVFLLEIVDKLRELGIEQLETDQRDLMVRVVLGVVGKELKSIDMTIELTPEFIEQVGLVYRQEQDTSTQAVERFRQRALVSDLVDWYLRENRTELDSGDRPVKKEILILKPRKK